MSKISTLASLAVLALFSGVIACSSGDDGDTGTSTSVGDGDGDGDTTGDGDGDGDGDTAGDGDGDTGCTPGSLGCPCDAGMCDQGLSCDATDTCSLGGGDGDGDGDGDTGNPAESNYDPADCEAPGVPITVMDVEGSFCSYPCTIDENCPTGPVGTQAGCALMGMDNMSFCALLCMTAADPDACPMGSICQDVSMGQGTGICSYP